MDNQPVPIDAKPPQSVPPTKKSFTPLAIIIVALLISGTIMYSSGRGSADASRKGSNQAAEEDTRSLEEMTPVSKDDHIRGSLDAPVKIVEYSDTECPFCKRFHGTMKQATEKYIKDGTVAWVYRHYPIDNLHPKARKEAEATECAAEIGGNDTFWAYLDRLMEVTPGNDNLDPAELPKIARYVGIDTKKFNECLASGKYAQKVEEHVQNAMATGGRGTPWSIVVGPNGKKYPLSGAQPKSAVEQLIKIASEEKQ